MTVCKNGEFLLLWWCTSLIPALWRQRQDCCEIEVSQGYIVRMPAPYQPPKKSEHLHCKFMISTGFT